MAFTGYEDQRLPRQLDDYEYEQAFDAGETCDVCGDYVIERTRIVFNGEVCCGSDCACVVLDEVMSFELARSAAEEACK